MEQLKGGVKALSQGSQGLTEGLQQFETAVGTAAEGSSKLNTALSQVSSAGGKLGSAYWELVDGMNAFADGVSEFDEEGIQSLAELAGPQYLDVIKGIRAARDAEHSYTNFSGICDGQKGSVRFIIETEEISAGD
jgi:putative membrane protein